MLVRKARVEIENKKALIETIGPDSIKQNQEGMAAIDEELQQLEQDIAGTVRLPPCLVPPWKQQ